MFIVVEYLHCRGKIGPDSEVMHRWPCQALHFPLETAVQSQHLRIGENYRKSVSQLQLHVNVPTYSQSWELL